MILALLWVLLALVVLNLLFTMGAYIFAAEVWRLWKKATAGHE